MGPAVRLPDGCSELLNQALSSCEGLRARVACWPTRSPPRNFRPGIAHERSVRRRKSAADNARPGRMLFAGMAQSYHRHAKSTRGRVATRLRVPTRRIWTQGRRCRVNPAARKCAVLSEPPGFRLNRAGASFAVPTASQRYHAAECRLSRPSCCRVRQASPRRLKRSRDRRRY